jgi:uncharacterized protein
MVRRGMAILLTVAAIYVVVCLLVMAGQRRMIYFPTCVTRDVAEKVAAQVGLKPWVDSHDRLIGWRSPEATNAAATIFVAHGNAGSAMHRDYIATPLRQAGPANVYILEYPGYGCRNGSPSAQSILAAGEAAFRALPTNLPIYVVSESLGAGVAAHLARTFPRQVAGLALIVPYDKFSSVAQHHMKFLPAGLLLRDRFAPAEWLKDYRGPAAFLLAGADTIIPPALGKRLHDGYAGPKTLFVVPDAGHNDVAALPAQWCADLFQFWREKR